MTKKDYFVHESAYVDMPCQIGNGTKIWHFTHIMKDVIIGNNCNLGQNVHVASGVIIGNNVKIQNNVSIYKGTVIEDDVFLGPSCVLTNVTNPRAQVNRHDLYEKTVFRKGTTVGANATIVCGIELGCYSFVAAGAVVTKNIPDYALIMGVPGKQAGWISRHGVPLTQKNEQGVMTCPESGLRYKEKEHGVLRCLDLNEDIPLSQDHSIGKTSYNQLKHRHL
jgi:UDP-2-acetamido-3-amino-2,3-dideoxy-glucuronate N-acetyltransferase